MHDIICPHCGESYIASDVAFDLSKYIIPLLCNSLDDQEDVIAVGFKYYIDIDTILQNASAQNKIDLDCGNAAPQRSSDWFVFDISKEMLCQYIQEKARILDLATLVEEIDEANIYNRYEQSILRSVQEICVHCFKDSSDYSGEFSMEDDRVKTICNILKCLVSDPTEKLEMSVRTLSKRLNGAKYYVPDVLFVRGNGLASDPIIKCCRYCGAPFPTEYGYYKMMPIVLLGAHFSAKSSFLVALEDNVIRQQPFISNIANVNDDNQQGLTVSTLDNDIDLMYFHERVRKAQHEVIEKTDWKYVPIVNIRVNDIIYTFIDWPGEAFLNEKEKSSEEKEPL